MDRRDERIRARSQDNEDLANAALGTTLLLPKAGHHHQP